MMEDRIQRGEDDYSSSTADSLMWKTFGKTRTGILNVFKDKRLRGGPESVTLQLVEENLICFKNVVIDTLNSEKYLLKKPIYVTIEMQDNVFIATNYDLDIYGHGDTEADSISELKNLIIEFYEDLKDEADLAPLPRKMMTYYSEIIEEK